MRSGAVVVAVAALVLAGCSAGEPAQPAASPVAEASPTVSLTDLRLEYGLPECPDTDPAAEPVDGGLPKTELPCLGTDQTVNLAGLPREPMLINLWAQWCGPCREEAPYLRAAHRKHDDVTFHGINYNDPQPHLAIEFAGLVEWVYPHVQDQDKTLQTSLGVPGIPMTLIVDADGIIRHRHPGPFESEQQLDDLLEEHLP